MKKFRVSFETLTFEDCRLFLEGTATLPGLPLCRTLTDLCKYVLEAYKEVLLFISDPHNFTKQPALSERDLEAKKQSVTAIFEQTDSDWLLFTSQDDVVKTLGFVNETKETPSAEYTSIIQKIEDVNRNERFQRERTEVLVERDHSETNNNKNLDKQIISSIQGQPKPEVQTLAVNNVPVTIETPTNDDEEETMTENIDTVDKVLNPFDDTFETDDEEKDERVENHNGGEQSDSLLREVVQEVRDCVEEIKCNNETFQREVRENIDMLKEETHQRAEVNNEKVLAQLSMVMEKLTQIESDRRQENEERRQEMEEVKRNQKNLMEFIQAQQKAKGKLDF